MNGFEQSHLDGAIGAIYKKDGKTFVRLTTEEETEGFLRNIKNLLGESL